MIIIGRKIMQIYHHSKKITLVQQACETVQGFIELYQRFKQKVTINGGSDSTITNYSRQLAAISLYYKKIPTSLTSVEVDNYLYYIKQNYPSISDTFFRLTIFSLRFVFRMDEMEYRCIQLPVLKSRRSRDRRGRPRIAPRGSFPHRKRCAASSPAA